MEINNKKISINFNNTAFKGKEVPQKNNENDLPTTYDDKITSTAIANVGKAIIAASTQITSNKQLKAEFENTTILDKDGNEVPRFNEEEVSKLVELSKRNSELVTRLVSEMEITSRKNKKTEPRFDVKSIEELIDFNEEYPDITEMIIEAKEPWGDKISDFAMKYIIDSASENPDLTRELLSMKKLNYLQEKTQTYSSMDIKRLVECEKYNPKLFKELLNAKTTNFDNVEEEKYSAQDIMNIMNAYSKNSKLVDIALPQEKTDIYGKKKENYTTSEILQLCELSEKFLDFIEELVSEKYETYKDWVIIPDYIPKTKQEPRFNFNQIKQIAEAYEKNPEYTKEFLSLKEPECNGITRPRFDGHDIAKLVNITTDNNINFIREIISETKTIPTSNNDIESRFSSYDIETLVKSNEFSEELTRKFIKKQSFDRHGNQNPAYSADDIYKLVSSVNNINLAIHMVDTEIEGALGVKYSRFGVNDTKRLTNLVSEENTENMQKLISDIVTNFKGKEEPRFNLYEIYGLANSLEINKELVMQLAEEKTINENGEETPKYNAKEIEEKVDKYLINKLVNEKIVDKDGNIKPRFDEYYAEKITKLSKLNPKQVVELLNETTIDENGNSTPKNNYGTIEYEVYSAFKDKIKNSTVLNGIKTPVSAYEKEDIDKIITLARYNPQLTNFMVDERKYDILTEKPRFTADEMKELVSIADKNEDVLTQIISLKSVSEPDEALDFKELKSLTQNYIDNLEGTKYLITELLNDYKSTNDNVNYLNAYISALSPLMKDNPATTKQLIEREPSNELKFSFFHDAQNIRNILIISDFYKANPNEIQYLMDSKTIDETGKEKVRFSNSDIITLAPIISEKAEITKSLLEEMSADNNGRVIPKYKFHEVSILAQASDIWGKNSIAELNKKDKRAFIQTLLSNKNTIVQNKITDNIRKKAPLIPNSEDEYVKTMNNLANSLNISLFPVSPEETLEFQKSLLDLANTLKEVKLSEISDIKLKTSHKEFIKKVESSIKHLNKDEQLKICDYYGFKIQDGKLSGYPTTKGKNTNFEDKNPRIKKVLEEVGKLTDEYNNNEIIINNKDLNIALTKLSHFMPEIYNQIDGEKEFKQTIKSLQKIVQSEKYQNLSGQDKQIIVLSTLLHKTDLTSNNPKESAFDAYFIAKKFNYSDEDAQKIYSIIESSDTVEKFMDTHKKKTSFQDRGSIVNGQERKDTFDMLAFRLKEDNTYELSQMLYSSKYPEGFTRNLDKALENRIHTIKSSDFILPQTSKEEIISKTEQKTVEKDGKIFKLQVANVDDIPDFYAFVHTTEAGFTSGGSREANFANFDAFNTLNDDKVICASYISSNSTGAVNRFHHEFIFNVKNKNQHVAVDYDMASHSRNINQLLVEYFQDKNNDEFYQNRSFERKNISFEIKSKLYGKNFYFDENVNTNYIKRIDNIKRQLGNKPMTLEALRKIDAEMAQAYEELFAEKYNNIFSDKTQNEVLVTNPEITGIITDDFENIPIEYLEKAQADNLPIVILNKKSPQ